MARLTFKNFEKQGKESRKLIIKRLTELGQDAIMYAFKQSYMAQNSPITGKPVWQIRTGNLLDSYGSAVFVKGVLQEKSIRYVDENTFGGRFSGDPRESNRSGREVLLDYLHKIHPYGKESNYSIVCVAAMYYAKFLEDGSFAWKSKSGLRYKIHVISSAKKYIDRNYDNYLSGIYVRHKIAKPKSRIVRGTSYDDRG